MTGNNGSRTGKKSSPDKNIPPVIHMTEQQFREERLQIKELMNFKGSRVDIAYLEGEFDGLTELHAQKFKGVDTHGSL